jgi:hypothetical protein
LAAVFFAAGFFAAVFFVVVFFAAGFFFAAGIVNPPFGEKGASGKTNAGYSAGS